MAQLPVALLSALKTNPRPIDMRLIQKAWDFAELAHTGQLRKSGEPFVTHPMAVAVILSQWNMDTATIVTGLLHDTIEEGGATHQDIVNEFGEEVAQLVDGVTKVTGTRLKGSLREDFVENLRKMILVMARDFRVVMVKLADRLHNMRTLQYLDKQSQLDNARETLEIYAPLAERLGMGELKAQLEDLSFPYVYPEEYNNLINQTKELFTDSENYIKKFRRKLFSLIRTQIPNVKINVRRKHLYSLWRKLQRPDRGGDLTKIHDLIAARVLVNSVGDCYTALGLIHNRFHPVPFLGMRDFIANPKPNGYRSIHTNIFGPEGRIAEIQIRTFAMHDQAEHGIAAHWQYADAKSKRVSDSVLDSGLVRVSDKLAWVRQLADWQKEITDNQEYLRALKFDALQHRNLVFSPVGDVYDLPAGATPVDYAYAVHTDLGHQAKGAKVNGKMVPLHHKLQNGDVVEIIIDRKRQLPNHEWLDFVVTNTARRQIQKALKPQNP